MTEGVGTTRRAVTGPISVGRYVLHREIASGGMATVYLGRLAGPAGFTRVVAIKRMHDLYASDPEFVTLFLDEASLAARIQHPNVAATLDVVAKQKEIFIVMDYVHGEALAQLMRTARKQHAPIPVGVVSSVLCGVLAGLHAAHIARGEGGEDLKIVHRDVSPQNILVGKDGLARVVDFGVAKAASRLHESGNSDGRGKLGYTSPERLEAGGLCDARADVFAVAVIAWEMLAGRRLFTGSDERSLLADVLSGPIPDLSTQRDDVDAALWAVLARGIARKVDDRWESAEAFAQALEKAAPVASQREVGAWVMKLAQASLEQRERFMREMDGTPRSSRASSPEAMDVHSLVEAIEGDSARRATADEIPPARSSTPSVTSGQLVVPPSVASQAAASSSGRASASDGAAISGAPPALRNPSMRKKALAGGAAVTLAIALVVGLSSTGPSDPPTPGSGADATKPAPETAATTKPTASSVPPPEASAPVVASASASPTGSTSAPPPQPTSTAAAPKHTSRQPPAFVPPKPESYLPDRP